MYKHFRSVFILLFLIFSTVVCFKLYLLEIDLHYGSLAEIFYESQDDYLVYDVNDKRISHIEKTWNRIYVLENENRVELKDWKEKSEHASNIIVYRPEISQFNLENISVPEFEQMVKNSKFTYITSN